MRDITTASADGSNNPFTALIGAAAELHTHGHAQAALALAVQALDANADGMITASADAVGEALLLARRLAEARTTQQARLAQDPTDRSAWTVLGIVAALTGDTAAAHGADARLAALANRELPGRARFARARIAAALGSGEAPTVLSRATAEGMPHDLTTHQLARTLEPR